MFYSFTEVVNIPFKPNAGPDETMVFRYYNSSEVGFYSCFLFSLNNFD